MSGFLQSLVARAEGRLPVLERRPRGLFETAPGAPVAVDEPQRPHAVSASPTREPPGNAGAWQAAARQPGGWLTAAPHATVHGTPVRSGRDDLALTQAAPQRGPSQPEASKPRPHPVTTPAQVHRTPPVVPHISTPTLPAVLAAARGHAAKPWPSDEVPAAPSRSDSKGADPEFSTRARANERPAAAAPGALQPRPAQPLQAALLLARQQSKAVPRREALAGNTPAVPAPVQISIGRIEIRATAHAGAERPRAAGPSAPKLSLDDYLRSRNGASR
jgi:hypothetical protein